MRVEGLCNSKAEGLDGPAIVEQCLLAYLTLFGYLDCTSLNKINDTKQNKSRFLFTSNQYELHERNTKALTHETQCQTSSLSYQL